MVIWSFVFIMVIYATENKNGIFGKEYMVQIKKDSLEDVKQQSEELHWKYKRKIVSNIYLFEAQHVEGSATIQNFRKAFEGEVLEVETRECSKLRFVPWLSDSPAPPDFKQWLLTTRTKPKMGMTWPYYGMDIQEAWSMGLTGQGIKVAIVDSGVELKHADLERNIDKEQSKSFAEDDSLNGNAKRLHSYPETDMYTSHGTKAAGLVAAEFGNGICSAGVAFNATIISLKVFRCDEPSSITPVGVLFPDDHITQALEYRRNEIDIYSCSFGLANMFATSTSHIKTVLKEGITEGRNGKGSIYVFSAGNLGDVYDCNTVAYTNSIYTITIASVGKGGTKPSYSMPCSSVLAATYGEFSTYNGTKYLETTTLDDECDKFTGTSASAALASGIVALVLQANTNLTWRDVQHLVVMSSSYERLKHYKKTSTNGNGLTYNPHFGFGLMNATKAILLAQNWTTVSSMRRFTADFRKSSSKNAFLCEVQSSSCDKCCLRYIEHVRVNIVYRIQHHIMESYLEISLSSPAGTRSVLFHRGTRHSENENVINRNWNFTSVQFWGEKPYGKWILRMRVRGVQFNDDVKVFLLEPASLTLYGTATDPYSNDFVARDSAENDISEDADCTTTVLIEDHKYFMNVVMIAIGIFIILCVCLSCFFYLAGLLKKKRHNKIATRHYAGVTLSRN